MALSGDRSPLFYWGGGAAKPLSTGTYAGPRSLLAFWLGGACFNFAPVPITPPYVPKSDLTGGVSARRGRPIDDDEIMEFIETWVAWQDIE